MKLICFGEKLVKSEWVLISKMNGKFSNVFSGQVLILLVLCY